MNKILSFAFWMIAITVACMGISNNFHNVAAMTAPTGVIVPLYSYPGTTWDELIKEKNTHPSVPIVAIINPDSGPGVKDSNYAIGVQKLETAGITVLGYVYTQNTDLAVIITYMNDYKNWYNVNGIFFDQMSNVPGHETFYKHLSNYAKSIGLTFTVGNPGTETLPSYIGTVDNIVLYDNPGLPSVSSLGGWHTNYAKNNFSIISYEVDNINSTYVSNVTEYVQYLYIADAALPNPFITLPSYLDNLIGMLENETKNDNTAAVTSVKSSLYQEEKSGTLEIDLLSISGEKADYHGTTLKIYQDNAKMPFTTDSLSGNPYSVSLPLEHRYKIEAYVSSMLASTGYVDLDGNKKLSLGIPDPGSLYLTFFYNDGTTPINNATVMVKSTDGTYEYWTNSTTDNAGSTIRYWLEATTNSDNYYVATVSLGNDLSYSYSPIGIQPGIPSNVKITTPWPAHLAPITVSIYKSNFQKISKSDGNFVVQLYDNNANKVAESKVNVAGETSFVNLKVGKYFFHVIDLNDPTDAKWNMVGTILDGKQTSVPIFRNTNDLAAQDGMNTTSNTSVPQNQIPIWVKNNAKWWAQNQVRDSDFVSGIQYLIEEGIMKIPPAPTTSDPPSEQIPSWIKTNAAWWAQGQISDNDFIKGIQYMISSGIIKISLV